MSKKLLSSLEKNSTTNSEISSDNSFDSAPSGKRKLCPIDLMDNFSSISFGLNKKGNTKKNKAKSVDFNDIVKEDEEDNESGKINYLKTSLDKVNDFKTFHSKLCATTHHSFSHPSCIEDIAIPNIFNEMAKTPKIAFPMDPVYVRS